jgi:E3 ubiquitin-protein ligase listerin
VVQELISSLRRPHQLLSILSGNSLNLGIDLADRVFLDQSELGRLLDSLPAHPSHDSLAVIDPLVLPGDWDKEEMEAFEEFDAFGYSSYARATTSPLLYFLDDRDAARRNIWALRHFLAVALYAKDVLHVPSADSPVFAKRVSKADLEDIVSKTDQLAAYLLTHSIDDGWFAGTLPRLTSGKVDAHADGVEQLLESLINPRSGDSIRESRILHSVLRHILPNVTKAEADQFILLGRSIEKKGEQCFDLSSH